MDPFRIAVRATCAFVFLLAITRLSGKRAVTHATALDFVLSLLFGDLVDDFVWADVSAARFLVAAGTLFGVTAGVEILTWRARISGPGANR